MHHGKYERQRQPSLLTWVLLCAALLTLLIGSVSAYLSMSGGTVSNSFSTAPYPEVTVDGTTVTVIPNGYALYLRVAVDAAWKNSTGVILTEELAVVFNKGEEWTEIDGFYYYKSKILPSNSADDSLTLTLPITVPTETKTGYDIALTVAAQVVQALGETDDGKQSAVENAWGVTPEQIAGNATS